MSFRRPPNDLMKATVQSVGASETNTVLGAKQFGVSDGSRLRIDMIASAFTLGAGITLKLQVSPGLDANGAAIWVDAKTAAVTATGATTITLNPEVAGDQAFLPLPTIARVVVTTGAGSALTVIHVNVLQR